jgi:hypothetical protein
MVGLVLSVAGELVRTEVNCNPNCSPGLLREALMRAS